MYSREYKVIKTINHKKNSKIHICELINRTEVIKIWSGNKFIFKEYNDKKNFDQSSEKKKEIINLSFKIEGLCKIIDILNEEDRRILKKDNTKSGCKGIILEYLEGDTLEKFIENGKYGDRKINKIISNLSLILYEMYKNKLVHRDIKPENIIISKDCGVTMVDLAYAAVGYNFKSQSGTPIYIAPEILKKEVYNSKIDIYSFGVTIFELINRKKLCDYVINDDFWESIQKLIIGYDEIIDQLINENGWDSRWKEIVKWCIKSDSEERWDAEMLYEYVKKNF